jgi:hypothetical protein
MRRFYVKRLSKKRVNTQMLPSFFIPTFYLALTCFGALLATVKIRQALCLLGL